MSQRPVHLVARIYHVVAAFFPVLARLTTHAAARNLPPHAQAIARLEAVVCELLALAARLNGTKLRQAALAKPRPPTSARSFAKPLANPDARPSTRRATTRRAPTRRPPTPRPTLSPHQMTRQIAALLEELETLAQLLAPFISARLRDLCAKARAEASRRLNPIRYVHKRKSFRRATPLHPLHL